VWRGADGREGEVVALLRAETCSLKASDDPQGYSVVMSLPDGKLLAGCCRMNEAAFPGKVSGRVILPPGAKLAANAAVEVKLFEIPQGDAPLKVIAEKVLAPQTASPVVFELAIETGAVNAANTYVLHVRITESGRLIFLSQDAPQVLTKGGPDEVDVMVKPLGQ
jgi:uncharacterized lipoprotein YbaY